MLYAGSVAESGEQGRLQADREERSEEEPGGKKGGGGEGREGVTE